jgi:hypothetical protein
MFIKSASKAILPSDKEAFVLYTDILFHIAGTQDVNQPYKTEQFN